MYIFSPKNKFDIGDLVTIEGYLGDVFEVVECHWDFYESFCYKALDTKHRNIRYDAFENEMTLYKKNNFYANDSTNKIPEHITKWQEYEDYLTLFYLFGDIKYQDAAVNIYCELILNRDNEL